MIKFSKISDHISSNPPDRNAPQKFNSLLHLPPDSGALELKLHGVDPAPHSIASMLYFGGVVLARNGLDYC
jgi:hypothetical protein